VIFLLIFLITFNHIKDVLALFAFFRLLLLRNSLLDERRGKLLFGLVSFRMDLTDESIGEFLKLIGLVLSEKVLFLFDFSPFGFVFGFVFFRLVLAILNSDPFFVMN
jgi:hypothetical protein